MSNTNKVVQYNRKSTKYSTKLCQELTKLMAAGFSDVQVQAHWQISKDTFYRWKREKEEFKEAHEVGKIMFDALHEQLGVEGMLKTKDIDYNFWRDLGKFRHKWTDKQAAGTTNNTQINIDKMNVLQQQTNEELIQYINNNIEELSGFTDLEPRQVIEASGVSASPSDEEEV